MAQTYYLTELVQSAQGYMDRVKKENACCLMVAQRGKYASAVIGQGEEGDLIGVLTDLLNKDKHCQKVVIGAVLRHLDYSQENRDKALRMFKKSKAERYETLNKLIDDLVNTGEEKG